MKIRCAICAKEVVLTKEDVQKLIGLSKTGKVRPERILKLENIYEGECEDGEEHTFSWDLEFLKQVEVLKGKQKELLDRKKTDKELLDKTDKEIEELKKKLEDAEKMTLSLSKGLVEIEEEIPVVISSFEEITGTKDLSEWK